MSATKRAIAACVLCGLVAVAVLAGCGTPPAAPDTTVRVGPDADRTQVHLTGGQRLEIALPGNVTTGYDWIVDGRPPSQVTTVTDSYESTAPAGVAGAGGVHTFVYTGASPGTGVLRFIYARAFTKNEPPARLFTLTVVVQ